MRALCVCLFVVLLAACSFPGQAQKKYPNVPRITGPKGTPAPTPFKIMLTATIPPEPRDQIGRYVNTNIGIKLVYPKNWRSQEGNGYSTLALLHTPNYEIYMVIMVSPIEPDEELKEAAQAVRDEILRVLDDVQIINEGADTLNNGNNSWVGEYEIETGFSERIGLLMTSTAHDQRLFTTMAYGLPEEVTLRRDVINGISKSIELSAPLRYGIPEDQALLTHGTESENPHIYDPAYGGGDRKIFSGLTAFTPEMELEGDLARSWNISPDGMVYTFHLHPNAQFHNGRPVTAEDVIYSWDRAAAPETGSGTVLTYLGDIVGMAERHSGAAPTISGLRALDEHTLEVRIDAPKSYFPMKLTNLVTFIVDRTNVESGPKWYRLPNGTGPYRLIRWEPGRVRLYERNSDFYLGAPKIPFIIEQIYPGLYSTGDLDMTEVFGSGYNLEIIRDPDGPYVSQLHEAISMCTDFIGIDSTKAPFDDPKVRQAFSMAVDRQRLIDIYESDDISAHGLYPPAMPGYNTESVGQVFDPEQARRLLAESSYGGAEGLPPIVFTNSGFGGNITTDQASLVEMWRRYLGVTVSFENLEPNYWHDAMLGGHHGQLYSYGWCADYPDPENFADALFHTGAQQNLGNYSNPELDSLLDRARTEPDVATRIGLYQQAEQHIVDQAAAIFLSHSSLHMLVQPRIDGYKLAPVAVPLERYLSIKTVDR